MFVTSNLKYGAPALDGMIGIGIAMGIGAIASATEEMRFVALPSIVPLKRNYIAAVAAPLSAPMAPQYETSLRLATPAGSPRNMRSLNSLEAQAAIFEAAQAKRARKQEARIIEAGGSISEEL